MADAALYTVTRASKIKSVAALEPRWVRFLLTLSAILFLILFLLTPLTAVFYEALKKGVGTYLVALKNPDALAAIRLTLLTAAIAVASNLIFGIFAAWAIAKFDFFGKNFLITL